MQIIPATALFGVVVKKSLRQEPINESASDNRTPRGIEEVFYGATDISDVTSFEFETTGERSGILLIISRIVRRKRLIAAAGILSFVATGFALNEAGYLDPEITFSFLNSHPVLAPAAFIAIFVVMTLLGLPTLPLNLGAGFLWGPYWGGFYTFFGASIGAAIAFLASRYIAADLLNRHFRHRAWIWLLEQVRQQDWKVVAFTRINPIFPTSLLNYFFGLTAIKFRPYLLATMVFIAPMALLFAYLGDSVGGFMLRGNADQFVHSILGVSAAISMLILLRFGLRLLLKGRRSKDEVSQS